MQTINTIEYCQKLTNEQLVGLLKEYRKISNSITPAENEMSIEFKTLFDADYHEYWSDKISNVINSIHFEILNRIENDKWNTTINNKNEITKEELFLSIIKDYIIKEGKDTYPNSILYFNPNGKVLFELKNSTLWCNNSLVWNVFYDKYGMNYYEIQSFIRGMAEKHFKMKGVTPRS